MASSTDLWRGGRVFGRIDLRLRWSLLVLLALLAAYAAVLHPWMMRWGATPEEQRMPLPGDVVTPEPGRVFTRAITIQASAADIWPWLVQIGQDRAGFYSYDWLENLTGANIHNADTIHPEWQQRTLGERVPMARPDYLGGRLGDATTTRIRLIEPERVLADSPTRFVLIPIDERTTRLLVREEVFAGPIAWLTWDPVHFVMQQRMLRGIRDRAEGRVGTSDWVLIAAHLGWVLAGVSVAGLFLSRPRWLPWGIVSAAAALPALWSGGDPNAALAGFLAVGGSVLGFLVYGRHWLGPYLLIAAVVLLVFLLAPDAYPVFGLAFLVLVLAATPSRLTGPGLGGLRAALLGR